VFATAGQAQEVLTAGAAGGKIGLPPMLAQVCDSLPIPVPNQGYPPGSPLALLVLGFRSVRQWMPGAASLIWHIEEPLWQ
jgi:hypothetical protein